MITSINRRIEDAEKRLQEFRRTQSFEGHVVVSNKNVVLPDAVIKDLGKKSRVLKIRVVSLAPVDDDLMLSIGGVKIFDTQLRVNEYYGDREQYNPLWQTKGFRIATVTRDEALKKGATWLEGDTVSVNTANTVGPQGRTAEWIAYLSLDNGITIKESGGKTETINGEGTQNVRNSPMIYFPNGSFKLI